jgi:hypothetical protein
MPAPSQPFIGDNTIRKIAARIEQSEPRFGCELVDDDVRAVDQASDRRCDVVWFDLIAS